MPDSNKLKKGMLSKNGIALASPGRATGQLVHQLSPREREVLAQVLTGKSCKEMADALDLSDHTIVDYMKRLHKHFGVNTRAELMAWFIPEELRAALTSHEGKI